MRTTLSIDDDVLDEARSLAERTKKPFRAIVNEALRQGLRILEEPALRKPYVTQPRPLALRPGLQIDNIQELLSLLDGEARG
ncbi:MAG: type II toxin-antitoxin system VapB family antitoxin [Planctomycetota bacterium]